MLKVKHVDPEGALADPLAADEATSSDVLEWAFPDELDVLRLELREMRAEIRETREAFEHSVRLAVRRDRIRTAARARRQRRRRGSVVARAILSLMVAVLTLAGAIAGIGVALSVIHLGGGSGYVTAAAVIFGIGTALTAWLGAALAAIVVETADFVRDLPV